jgi:hypothetical protein
MKFTPLILPLLLIGCAPRPAPPAEPLNSAQCKTGEFRGVGIGTNEKEALNEAKSDLAKQIHSSVQVSEKYRQSQNVRNGKETLGSDFVSETLVEANLQNAHDARVLKVEQKVGKINTVVCMTKADAAKGFIERQRLVIDSLELASNTALKTEHPKRKNEAWHKTQTLWNEFARIQNLLDGWGIEKASFYEPASEIYSQTKEDYKNYCQTLKLHWQPERENDYSSIAFSMLSKNLKMEKSACQGNGISLVYRYAEPDCPKKFGVHNCSYKPSLSILSCDGTEYSLLENTVENSHQKQELALEKIKDTFKAADFWGKWEKEIKEWRPKCE